ncbi:MAG: hypothetical protein KJ856_21055 [Gammaproteobacteria bacterium]|nr:hypothetical protein [Gammaproteobacteria bacterium]MBU1477727.1 hypothetical protein [Gammaproteobacteria bacterium]MBU2001058.1 hypothetical protein [Gammaproteobacteria bacterium]MBU2132380.1 hypothetical protein [Gammaproteobacteria bacterium]MBU2189479.1 hypothetical protein [Gammaproteobacteria bacterium]
MSPLDKILNRSMFDVEHALSLYATSFFYLPAKLLYDKERLEQYKDVSTKCHIYIVGFLPTKKLLRWCQEEQDAVLEFEIGSVKYDFKLPLPKGCRLESDDIGPYAVDEQGQRFVIPEDAVNLFLQHHSKFEVKYVGQAYGKDGSRNAIDRLMKHETLQKISLTGVPANYELQLLLLEVEPSPQLITAFNPFAQQKDKTGSRIKAGLDKLFNTSEQERISLYEAALIRYFRPQFNLEFKDSFPSTRLKILHDCYEKDFSMISAEINFDEIPFQLWSGTVPAKHSHMAIHDLHDDKSRKAFFYEK